MIEKIIYDIVLKKIFNRESTDPNYNYWNENIIYRDIYPQEVWISDVPTDVTAALESGVVELFEGQGVKIPTPTNSLTHRPFTVFAFYHNNKQVRNFVPPVFAPEYTVEVRVNGELVPQSQYLFEYSSGVLYIQGAVENVAIRGFLYKGMKLKEISQQLELLSTVASTIQQIHQIITAVVELSFKVYTTTITPQNKTITPPFRLVQNKFLVYDNGLYLTASDYDVNYQTNTITINTQISTEHNITVIALSI